MAKIFGQYDGTLCKEDVCRELSSIALTLFLKGDSEMKHDYHAAYGTITIRPLRSMDIETLRVWRNDEENSRFLRKIGYITPQMQINWFQEYLNNENELVFAIDETKELKCMVGSMALYNWDRKMDTCEIGKIQIGVPEAHGKGIGRKSLVLAMKIAYQRMGVRKILASVHPDNSQAYHNDMKIGFHVVGLIPSAVGGHEFELEITEEDVKRANDYYDSIMI